MCGIAGVVYADRSRRPSVDLLRRMGAAIAHRGPDGEGVFVFDGGGLVHRRLAIIDLAGGSQPIANEDGSINIVFNGEIYNYRSLRSELTERGHRFRTSSDTEVLVHLYEEHGPEMLTRLRGMFAFAIHDRNRQRVLLARDHIGQKPLYIYRDARKLVFGSELKAILAHGEIDRVIDAAAIEDYLTFGVIPGDRSVFGRIRKLPAAHWLIAAPGEAPETPQRYWSLEFREPDLLTQQDWAERIDSAFSDAVESHMIADVPVGAFLSGGLDSSAIVSAICASGGQSPQTFAVGFAEREFSELPCARAVADHFGTKHTEEIVTPDAVRGLDDLTHYYDEPFADASAIPTMAIARVASRSVKVVLTGDGGDEAFGGYSRYLHDLKEDRLRGLLPSALRRTLVRQLGRCWPKADWLPRVLRLKTLFQNLSQEPAAAYANTLSVARQELRSRLLTPELRRQLSDHRPEQILEDAFRAGNRDTLSGMLSADTRVLLPDDFLVKVDRATMACGLEARPPLLDYRLLELAAAMPSEWKVRAGKGKWMLREIFEPRLPAKLKGRRKQGFDLPVDQWLRGPLVEQLHEVVLSSTSPLAPYVDINMCRNIESAHARRTGQHGQLLWSLLVLGRWLDHYTSDSPLSEDPPMASAAHQGESPAEMNPATF